MKNMNRLDTGYQPDFYKDYDNHVAELDRDIYLDKLKFNQYMDENIRNIKKFDKEYLCDVGLSKKHKIPFKLRFNNFKNKIFNTIR